MQIDAKARRPLSEAGIRFLMLGLAMVLLASSFVVAGPAVSETGDQEATIKVQTRHDRLSPTFT